MIMKVISYNFLRKRLISQKYKKCSPGKYTLLLYIAVSIRWISIRFDMTLTCSLYINMKHQKANFFLGFPWFFSCNFARKKICVCAFYCTYWVKIKVPTNPAKTLCKTYWAKVETGRRPLIFQSMLDQSLKYQRF